MGPLRAPRRADNTAAKDKHSPPPRAGGRRRSVAHNHFGGCATTTTAAGADHERGRRGRRARGRRPPRAGWRWARAIRRAASPRGMQARGGACMRGRVTPSLALVQVHASGRRGGAADGGTPFFVLTPANVYALYFFLRLDVLSFIRELPRGCWISTCRAIFAHGFTWKNETWLWIREYYRII